MCCYTTREYINNWIGTLFSSEICGIFQPEILIWRCHRLTTADFRYHHHHHHIWFWYLRFCGCPGLWGRQHHQQTNTKFFTGRMSFLSPNQQRQSTVRGTPCKFTYWLLTEVCVTHLPDFTPDHQRYPYTQQYVQFVTCCSGRLSAVLASLCFEQLQRLLCTNSYLEILSSTSEQCIL